MTLYCCSETGVEETVVEVSPYPPLCEHGMVKKKEKKEERKKKKNLGMLEHKLLQNDNQVYGYK